MSVLSAGARWLWCCGTVLLLSASVQTAPAQTPSAQNLPALSPAPTQRSVPAGPNVQTAPDAQMQQPPISLLSQHVDAPSAPSQDEAYLAQAKSTEIAARSNWKKAEIELDHDLGDLLEKNHIVLDDAIRGKLPQ